MSPTFYQYYTHGGITSGLSDNQPYFLLNNRNITILSGTIHYFRVHPEYWRDRLRKIRAAGLNAIDTYVPWNLHEPSPGRYDFGKGGSDFEEFLDIKRFLQTAQEEDLFVILRPGPYISAEWEFGGLPSWLLRDKGIKIRTTDEKFMVPVRKYFSVLLSMLALFQFSKGGPIVAFQIENEYPGKIEKSHQSLQYLIDLKGTFVENGIIELLFISNPPDKLEKFLIPGILNMGNFQTNVKRNLKLLKKNQPSKPLMVMEYWSGWYDQWMHNHSKWSVDFYSKMLIEILSMGASVNIYMFHGGTSFGFMNGADGIPYFPITNSYDYDAPLTEAGGYTEKYFKTVEVLQNYNNLQRTPLRLPQVTSCVAYAYIDIIGEIKLVDILDTQNNVHQCNIGVIPMELLPIYNNTGQSYGYIAYRRKHLNIFPNSTIQIIGHVRDTAMVLINGRLISPMLNTMQDLGNFGCWGAESATIVTDEIEYLNATLDIIVENFGRMHHGTLSAHNQYKGLWEGNVTLNNDTIVNWEIYPLEFKKSWSSTLLNWNRTSFSYLGPALYRGILNVQQPKDTFIDMRNWGKGIIIVNGFVLSRHLRLGPQQTAYLPAPLLHSGINEIIIFEHFKPGKYISFSGEQIFLTRSASVTRNKVLLDTILHDVDETKIYAANGNIKCNFNMWFCLLLLFVLIINTSTTV